MHVAYSDVFQGAGIFAGGPYYCAKNDFEIAYTACTKNPELVDL